MNWIFLDRIQILRFPVLSLEGFSVSRLSSIDSSFSSELTHFVFDMYGQ